MADSDNAENKIKLYIGLVDQVQKYSAIFWQFPTALLATNLFAFEKFVSHPGVLLGTTVLNGVLIFAYYKLVRTHRAIIEATQRAEAVLRAPYGDFIPTFPDSKVRSPIVVAWTLVALNGVLVLYALFLLCKGGA